MEIVGKTPQLIKNLLSKEEFNLAIPDYQRPYVWNKQSVYMMFNDIKVAFEEQLEEYRLGTIILHKDKDKNNKDRYNIVDGQQRLITLSLLLYILDEKINLLLDGEINYLSNNKIKENYHILLELVNNKLNKDERCKYKDYMLDHCTLVVIITEKQEEAFQFFDSQNTRGKELAPHDLLKAYHLREMEYTNISKYEKEELINQWESIDADELKDLFADYLYPLTQWYKGRNGLYYDKTKIDVFKGISNNINKYNFALFHKGCENYQLTQPFIAGEKFFKYGLHYYYLLQEVEKIINECHKNIDEVPNYKTGNIYIRRLYTCALLFFIDRFNIKSLEKVHIKTIYKWCYSLRLVLHAVYRESVNKYAKDKHNHNELKDNDRLFIKMSEMLSPDEILNINVKTIEEYEAQYEAIGIKCKSK